jgi:hypothetical protein
MRLFDPLGSDPFLRSVFGGTRLSRPPHNVGYPLRIYGHDKRAPPALGGTCLSGPFSEGRACRVRRIRFDNPSCFIGHDKRAPPTPGGTCLLGPQSDVG